MAHIDVVLEGNFNEAFAEKFRNWNPDFSEPLKQCGIQVMRSVDLNFKAEGRPNKWKPLSGLTLMNRRSGSGKILQDNAKLKQSIVDASKGAAGGIYSLTKDTLKVGTNLVYANIHQYGGVIKAKNKKYLRIPMGRPGRGGKQKFIFRKSVTIPQRKFLMIQPQDERYFERIFMDWMKKELGL